MPGALYGIRVIDLSRVLGGPYCTQTLADHGADVIKVEPPQGDETRGWGPPFNDELSAYFSGANRNKRSIALDLRTVEGREVVLRLLEDADVLVHNFKTGAMERWALGYEEDLAPRFPGLIFCHVTGFGANGPLGGFPGYDAVVQAMTGLMSINGDPASGATRLGIPMVDLGTGLIAANAILAALVERGRSGKGQAIEVPLFDSAISLTHPQAANTLMSGKVPVSTGNGHPNIVPYDTYETRTCALFLAVGNNGQFAKLAHILGIPEVIEDPRFVDNAARIKFRSEITKILTDRLSREDANELEPRLMQAGIPAGVVRTVTDALAHPHTIHRDMVVEKDGYKGTGIPAKFSRTPGSVRRCPPKLGEHSKEVLQELGLSEERQEQLLSADVVISGE